MLISVCNSARDGCQRYKALHESAEPFIFTRLLTSARLYRAGFVLTYKTKDVST